MVAARWVYEDDMMRCKMQSANNLIPSAGERYVFDL